MTSNQPSFNQTQASGRQPQSMVKSAGSDRKPEAIPAADLDRGKWPTMPS